MSSDALRYALATLGNGVRQVLGEEINETPRDELIAALNQTFRGPEELKGALEEAFERSLQSLVIGLKQAWLLMETGGEHDYCEAFGNEVRTEFVAEHAIEGRLYIDFLDGFFLDYDTANDAATPILGLPELDGLAFFRHLLEAGGDDPATLAARATESLRIGFINEAGLEEEHPIVRLGCWRDLLADGLHYHLTDIARSHPSWSRYLEKFRAEALDREEIQAIAKRDAVTQERIGAVRALNDRRAAYATRFGDILPNLEWLFDIADRLEETDENTESDLLKGRTIAAADLPKIVAVGVGKVHAALKTSPVGRLSDVLTSPSPGIKDVLRRARRDFRRCHWGGEDYGQAALQLAGAMLPLVGPRASQRYYREAGAFGSDPGTIAFSLYLTELFSGEFGEALVHLQRAVEIAPERFAIFDFQRYPPLAILGAGGCGPSFLVSTDSGEPAVVKTLWDPVSVVDPRPGLKPLAMMHKASVGGLAQLLHLGVHLKEFPYVTTAFVEGDDLESFREARGGTAPSSQVAMIGALIAARLVAIHAAGVAHMNLKPGNVRVGAGEEGLTVTLLDPSVPNVLLAAEGRVANVRRLLAWSRVGRVIAEDFAAYTAPEVIKGGLAAGGPAADLYALGGLLYRLATGAPPRRPNPAALPSTIRDIIIRLLSRDPSERLPTAQEAWQALDAAAQLPDETAPVVPPPQAASTATAPPPPPPPAAQQPARGPGDAGFDPFAGLGTSTPDAAAVADPFAAPGPGGLDPFSAPTIHQPGADPFAAPGPGGLDAFAPTINEPPPGADPFAATLPPGQLGAPAADPFAVPADPFAAPADPFAAPTAADPFAAPADPFAVPAGADPFAAPADPFAAPTAADPFAAPAAADPFAAPADPFAVPAEADPFAPSDPFAQVDPFATPTGGDPLAAVVPDDPFAAVPTVDMFASTADPFAGPQANFADEDEEELEPLDPNEALAMLESMMGPSKPTAASPGGADPFAGGGPFAQQADPFAAPAGGNPLAAPAGADPFAAPAGPDPFAAPAGPDPFAAPAGADPFAVPAGADPFAAPAGADPFAVPAGADPFAAPAGADPFAAPAGADPFAAPAGADPFAAPADPFAAAAGGADPFAAAAGGADPFAAAAGGADPFAAAAGGADPFAAAAGGADPFAAAAMMQSGASDPFAAAAQSGVGDPFAAAAANDPFAAPTNADVSPGGLWLSNEEEPAPPPPKKPTGRRKKETAASYGLVISGLGLKSKKEAAVKILMKLKACSLQEARDMCRSPVVPVLKGVSKGEVDAAQEMFKAAKVNCRVTSKRKKR